MVRQTHYILFLNINIVFNIHLCYHFCNVSYHNIIKTTNYLSLCLKRRTTGGTRTAQEFRDTTALPVPVVYINYFILGEALSKNPSLKRPLPKQDWVLSMGLSVENIQPEQENKNTIITPNQSTHTLLRGILNIIY